MDRSPTLSLEKTHGDVVQVCRRIWSYRDDGERGEAIASPRQLLAMAVTPPRIASVENIA